MDLNDQMLRYARWRYDHPGQDAAVASSAGGGGQAGGGGKPSAGQKAGKGFAAAPAPASGGTLQLVKGDMATFELQVCGARPVWVASDPDSK